MKIQTLDELKQAIKDNKAAEITDISLPDTKVGDEGWNLVLDQLRNFTNLRTLQLSEDEELDRTIMCYLQEEGKRCVITNQDIELPKIKIPGQGQCLNKELFYEISGKQFHNIYEISGEQFHNIASILEAIYTMSVMSPVKTDEELDRTIMSYLQEAKEKEILTKQLPLTDKCWDRCEMSGNNFHIDDGD